MSPHIRVLLFCISILAAPALWLAGEQIGGDLGGGLLTTAVVLATVVYAQRGQRPKPPSGVPPS